MNFSRIIGSLLPLEMRRPRIFSLLSSLLQPLSKCREEFDAYSADVRLRLSFNGQVCYLRGALRTLLDDARFDIAPPRRGNEWWMVPQQEIVKVDGEGSQSTMVRDSLPSVGRSPSAIAVYPESSIAEVVEGGSFVVLAPAEYFDGQGRVSHRVAAVVDTYRLVGSIAEYQPQ